MKREVIFRQSRASPELTEHTRRKLITSSRSDSKFERKGPKTEFSEQKLDLDSVDIMADNSDTLSETTELTKNDGGGLDNIMEDGEGEGYKIVGNKGALFARQRANKDRVFGVRVSREGKRGHTTFTKTDLKILMKLIANVDPEVLFFNHQAKERSVESATSIQALHGVDWTGRLDMQSEPWGRPSDNRERTNICFYILSNKIGKNLRELRDDNKIKQWMNLGKCVMNQTRLMESQNTVIMDVMDKDPNHTHRDALAERIESWISTHNGGRKIPVNVVTIPSGSGGRVVAISVGKTDEKQATKILQEHPEPCLQMVPHRLRRANKQKYQERVSQHELIVSQTKAFKLIDLPHHKVQAFRDTVHEKDVKSMIVDISEANHSRETGTTYVQYIQSHEATVRDAIQDILQMTEFSAASLYELDGSVKIALASKQSAQGDTVPVSRFAELIDKEITIPNRAARKKTSSAKSKKSFAQALAGSDSDTSSSEESKGDSLDGSDTKSKDSAGGSTINTAKTAREIELENQNAELTNTIKTLQETITAMNAKFDKRAEVYKTQSTLFQKQSLQLEQTKKENAVLLQQQTETTNTVNDLMEKVNYLMSQQQQKTVHPPTRTPDNKGKRHRVDRAGLPPTATDTELTAPQQAAPPSLHPGMPPRPPSQQPPPQDHPQSPDQQGVHRKLEESFSAMEVAEPLPDQDQNV